MRICCVFYPICVKGVEDRLDVERLLCWAALHAEDPLELVEVQGSARTLPHEHDAQLLNVSQIQLLTVALFLSHVRLIPVIKKASRSNCLLGWKFVSRRSAGLDGICSHAPIQLESFAAD